MKTVAVLCGGSSYEHEVSIITGLQVAEALDRSRFTLLFVYFDKDNQSWLIPQFRSRKDFARSKRQPVDLVKRKGGFYIQQPKRFNKKTKVDVCYLAFHGGTGESGQIHGLLELMDVAHTAPSQEGSVIAMNKSLTKEVLRAHDLPTLPSVTVYSAQYEADTQQILTAVKQELSLPIIIKPVHLGSSIAIEIAHTDVELEKYLNVATRVDDEILLEPALQDFTEYNVSVRSNEGELECSPIEEPKRADEILSFDDKYANGSKKTGGKQSGGMELLDRTVPAKISDELATEITTLAKAAYRATRLDGLVRIDFMYSDGKLYCSEINPIPGSMSFYLWEPTGEQFRDQITQALEDALVRFENRIKIEPYHSDIVEKFVS